MSQLRRILPLLCLCIWVTGCIEEHALSTHIEDPVDLAPEWPPTDLPPECEIENPECDDDQICVGVTRCIAGHVCSADESNEYCSVQSYVCDEYAHRSECVEPLSISDECTPSSDRCGDGLACQVDDEICGSNPSCAPGQICDTGCWDVYTCQPDVPCQGAADCQDGLVCDIPSGDCIVPQCTSDADCGDGNTCEDGTCGECRASTVNCLWGS
jgi:hypothetical protein